MTQAALQLPAQGPVRRPGFTLIEILLAVAILGLLIGLLVVGMSKAFKGSAIKAHEQTLATMKMAVDQFTQEFGFPPPLVKGNVPLPGTPADRIPVYIPSDPGDALFLRRATGAPTSETDADVSSEDKRYSKYSLPYYLAGACDFKPAAEWQVSIDGVTGGGLLQPLPDGSFKVPPGLKRAATGTAGKSTGRAYEPFIDTSKATLQLVHTSENRAELRDRKNVPYRYYRWLPDNAPFPVNLTAYNDNGLTGLRAYLNVPVVVGDPETDSRLRDATWAIVWAGSDKLFGDESFDQLGEGLGMQVDAANELAARQQAMKDNVVEVGK